MSNVVSLFLFLVVVVGGGISIGTFATPDQWYAELQKPFFNPPNWIFGPVWTVLYVIIAIVGWRVWKQKSHAYLFRLWVVQMCLNFIWSPVFFAAQNAALALAVIGGLLLSILLFIRTAWRLDLPSALLFFPYAAWVGFASVLNTAIVYLN